ncbi:MAG: cadherin-like domain-containing protein, partial [Phycisphaeraceae bacterium]|nr:cadherin-like domain-containing protein [Phycisphaeraceae bacterium]
MIEDSLTANFTRVTSQYNGDDGIALEYVQTIDLLDTNASYNGISGLYVTVNENFTDTHGIYTENEDTGIYLEYIYEDATLTRTTATNNNADNGEYGAGLDVHSLGYISGTLLIEGGTFSDTDASPFNGNTFHQTDGIYIEDVTGEIIIRSHDNGSDIQNPIITGNEEQGIGIYDSDANVAITNADISNNYGEGLDVDFINDLTIQNSTFNSDNGFGLWVTNALDVFSSDLIVQENHLGILAGEIDNFTDTNSLFANNANPGMSLHNINVLLSLTGTQLKNNGTMGLYLTDIEGANLTQLTVTGNNVGIHLKDFIHAFDLTNSFVSNNDTGILVDELLHNFGINVFDNDLSGNTTYAVQNADAGPAKKIGPVNASGNWWGTSDESTILNMTDGLVDFTPYLCTGTDISADAGFQGDFGILCVTTLGEQTQTGGRLQEAMGLAPSNGTINVNVGNFAEDVTVNQNKTLTGPGNILGTVTLLDTAQYAPGNSPGQITLENINGSTGQTLIMEIDGTTPGTEYDQLVITGDVTLNNIALEVIHNVAMTDSQTYTFIDNQGSNPVHGTFNGLPEGDTFTLDSGHAVITYVGGDGNDVQLTFNTNTAPTADDMQSTAVEDAAPITLAYSAHDVDLENPKNLAYTILTQPTQGIARDNGDGTFTFNPNRESDFQDLGIGETRQVSFTYQVTDSHGTTSRVATVMITVTGTNDYPVAAPNLTSTQYQSAIDIEVLNNDMDVDGDTLHVSGFDAPTSNMGVTITLNSDNTIHYDPTGLFDTLAQGETVRDFFRYDATDAYGLSDRHIVFVDITRPVT